MQTDLSGLYMRPLQLLSLGITMDLKVIEMKRYCTLPEYPELEPHRQFRVLPKAPFGIGVLSLSREYNHRIQSTADRAIKKIVLFDSH